MQSINKPHLYSKSRLAVEFELDRKTVTKRIEDCTPDDYVKGNPVYKITTVAPYLVESTKYSQKEIEDDPDLMSPEDQKNYWDAQLKKQKFEENEGDLWETIQVVEVISSLFKPMANLLRTLPDTAERELGLNPEQTEILQELCAEKQNDLYEEVILKNGRSASEV